MNGLYLRNVVALEACLLGCLVTSLIHETLGFLSTLLFCLHHQIEGKEQSSRDTSFLRSDDI